VTAQDAHEGAAAHMPAHRQPRASPTPRQTARTDHIHHRRQMMRPATRRSVAAILFLLAGLLVAPAEARSVGDAGDFEATSVQPADTARLRRALDPLVSAFAGTVGISVRNLATNETLSIRGHEKFPSASLIKVSVLVALLEEVHQGRMRLDERSSMVSRDRVGGTGVMKHFGSGTSLTIEDLAWLMITISDNTATNLLLDKLDIATVGVKMDALGLPHSRIHSKTFRRQTSIALDSSVLYGLGVTTPDEMTQLFALLHEGRAVSPALDSVALRMLFAQQDAHMMRRWLPANVRVAHKTGYVDRARTDCGIMYAPAAPIALCVMTRENEATSYAVDAAPHLLIAGIAREVFRHWNPGVPLPETR
jgi:beta-lactamase class A